MTPPSETAPAMHVVATAGHVDHGKSALVRALTGTDPDRFAEEQRRGLTIDLGFAWTTLPRAGPVVFVDVPGHVRFIANMLAGVAVIEAGVLCVDAREGWRAQSEEHLRVLDLIGLPTGLVALTKAGLVDDDRIAEVRDEVARRSTGTVLAGAPVVACDSIQGTGLDELRDQLDHVLASRSPAPDHGRPRLWVDRSFTIAGAGTVVTGGVAHGAFTPGDRVVAVGARGSSAARVRGIQSLGRQVDRAPPGSRAALNLAGLGRRGIRRGDAIVRPADWHVTQVADASLTVLDSVDHEVTRRGAYLAYLGAGERAVNLRVLRTARLDPGSTGEVRMTFPHALPLVAGDRYVLRETGRGELIGGGELLDVAGIADWERADELERRLGVTVEPNVGSFVVSPAGLQAARKTLLARLEATRPIGLDLAQLDERDRAVVTLLETEGAADTVAGYAVDPAWTEELARHPFLQLLQTRPFSPPEPSTTPIRPEELRALLRRGLVISKGGVYFAATTPTAAARVLVKLSQARPDGFTVSEARQALGMTRKWAVPLLELLDEAGITLRRGDRRQVRDPQKK